MVLMMEQNNYVEEKIEMIFKLIKNFYNVMIILV